LSGIAQRIILVTNEDTSVVMDCYALIKRICSVGTSAQLGSVVNFASRDVSARDVHARLAVSCDRFLNLHLETTGMVMDDRRIHDANCAGRPFVVYAPQSEATYQINTWAEQLIGRPPGSRQAGAA